MEQKPYNQHIQSLAEKWLNGTITPEEEKEFAHWYNQFDDEAELLLNKTFAKDKDALKERMYSTLDKRLSGQEITANHALVHRVHFLKRGWFRLAAAAAVTGIVAVSAYLLVTGNTKPAAVAKNTVIQDVPPGGNKAVLTLADGTSIVLDSMSNGKIAEQGKGQVTKLADGHIVYTPAGATHTAEILYNTLSTPRGGMQQLGLPDGTQVWLNSASSIRYPTAFAGKERMVEITGEAYFEVSHLTGKEGKRLSFVVKAKNTMVEVLGTHFNVNAYNDEADTKTTLLEGSVKVKPAALQNSKVITPGQQAQLPDNNPSDIQVTDNVDIDKVMAWKTGFFEFDNTTLPVIMQQVGRWYDVDIAFEGKPSAEKFGGRISKSLPLSKILKLLETNGVEFRLEGRKLIIQP